MRRVWLTLCAVTVFVSACTTETFPVLIPTAEELIVRNPGAAERAALVALYEATDGANWSHNDNWLSAAPVAAWYGVVTDGSGHVTELNLPANGLSGPIPDLSALSGLTYLDLGGNQLSGPVPDMSALVDLIRLSLAGNRLCLPEDTEVSGLSEIAAAHLQGLNLPACPGARLPPPPNPGAVEERAALVALYEATDGANWTRSANWLSDKPLGAWQGVTTDSAGRVTSLDLTGNQLSGEIPPELGKLSYLTDLYISDNRLSGCVPGVLRDAPNNDLAYLDLPDCDTPTPASEERAALVALYEATDGANWTLSANWLSDRPLGAWHGVTTDSAGRVTSLALTGNQLSGEIPSELANLTNLTQLHLEVNELSGSIPPELGNLTNLTSLDLRFNRLSGEIPPELGNLTRLKVLILELNQLGGAIPPELGKLARLNVLALASNRLGGEIPSELGNLTYLSDLYISDNRLNGEIPVWLGQLTNLRQLHLGFNQLSGKIPSELGNLAYLTDLYISDNRLSGEIPVWLGQLTNLRQLHLGGNWLSGEIPAELGNLTNLTSLDLSSNQLTGPVPDLSALTRLSWLNLRGNLLCLPEGAVLSGPNEAAAAHLRRLNLSACAGRPLRGDRRRELVLTAYPHR